MFVSPYILVMHLSHHILVHFYSSKLDLEVVLQHQLQPLPNKYACACFENFAADPVVSFQFYFCPLWLTIRCLFLFRKPLQYSIPTVPISFEEFFLFNHLLVNWLVSSKELTSARPLDGQRQSKILAITSTIFITASSIAARGDWISLWWSWLATGCF